MEFRTNRLTAKTVNKTDITDMFRLHSNDKVMKYIRRTEQSIKETEKVYLKMCNIRRQFEGLGMWSVFLSGSKDYIGWVILKPLGHTREIEIGYRLFPEYWGNGYATEISFELCRYGFNILKLEKIIGIPHPENTASQKVLQKLGMIYQKRTRYYGTEVDLFTIRGLEFEMKNTRLQKTN